MKQRLLSVGEQGSHHVFSQNKRITQLGKSGQIEDAIKVFTQMAQKNTVTYNSMISVYAKNGRINAARNLFDKMPRRNLVSWNTMVSGYLHNGKFDEAYKLFVIMPRRDLFSWTLMITCYTRNGEVEKARELFDSLPCSYRKGVACWNAMISGYVKKGRVNEAKRLFDEMPVKNLISWNSMLAGYTQNRKMRLGLEFFNEMDERDVVSWNLMVDGFIQVGDLDSAWKFFQEIPKPNVVSWVTMLSYARHGRINEALCLSKRMVNKDMVTWNTMISCYAQEGQMDRAVKIFEEMGERDLVSWNSLIAGFMLNGQNLDALKSFALMGHEGKKPDQLSFACGLSSCATIAALQVGNQLHQVVVKSGYLNYLVVNNALITMYAKCGRILEAELVFNGICHADVISWNSLIGGYAINGYGKEALKLFEKMASEGMAPDEVTFIGILSACNHAGMVDHGLKLFKCMSKVYAIEPLAEHYACMVDLLGRVGRLDEAFEIVRGMKVKATAGVWGALLGACRAHGNLELGRLAAHKLSEFEPHKTSNYVLLSNIHAEANRWNEVQEVRMLMNASSSVKEPGCSWVEVRNQVHGFLSDDSTQSRPDIGVTLASLNSHIRNAFHISEVSA
ncbi:hypothetical protein POTOM_051224 [Populus tomentosa]|uniref:Pentatricopeptide repeat-containing protein n=1 Tax=Populus tomentosa TaxID=118781 RepID=A0A8X7Y9T0_POPTO|nr:hypothetical protein POTOM_051224 [Populus tomentosa]